MFYVKPILNQAISTNWFHYKFNRANYVNFTHLSGSRNDYGRCYSWHAHKKDILQIGDNERQMNITLPY